MNDTVPVGSLQRIGYLDAILQHLSGRKCPLEQTLPKGFSLQVLHNQEVRAVLLTHVVQGTDMGMGQTG